jgi:hypothetical protein
MIKLKRKIKMTNIIQMKSSEQIRFENAIGYSNLNSLRRYIERKIETGGFLRAVLENDLNAAVFRADNSNRKLIVQLVQYLEWYCPRDCHGSPEIVKAWLSNKEVE